MPANTFDTGSVVPSIAPKVWPQAWPQSNAYKPCFSSQLAHHQPNPCACVLGQVTVVPNCWPTQLWVWELHPQEHHGCSFRPLAPQTRLFLPAHTHPQAQVLHRFQLCWHCSTTFLWLPTQTSSQSLMSQEIQAGPSNRLPCSSLVFLDHSHIS